MLNSLSTTFSSYLSQNQPIPESSTSPPQPITIVPVDTATDRTTGNTGTSTLSPHLQELLDETQPDTVVASSNDNRGNTNSPGPNPSNTQDPSNPQH